MAKKKKPNNNIVDSRNCPSQLDFGGVLRDVHVFPDHSLRVTDTGTITKEHYDNFTVQYDVDGNPTRVCYFTGLTTHETSVGFLGDVAGSLNNTYFFIYESKSDTKFHIWYNVSGAGVDPAPVGSIGIEVAIDTNDSAIIVATATKMTLELAANKEYFCITQINAVLKIDNIKRGETPDTTDFDTGFVISNTQGTKLLVDQVDVSYSGSDPVWQGQVLKDHALNLFTGKFERKNAIDVEVEIKDYVGHTPEQINGSVTTAGTPVTLSAVSGKITAAEVYNPRKGPNANDKTDVLLVSWDGTTYTSVPRGESVAIDTTYIDDFKVDSNNDSVNYEVTLTHD